MRAKDKEIMAAAEKLEEEVLAHAAKKLSKKSLNNSRTRQSYKRKRKVK